MQVTYIAFTKIRGGAAKAAVRFQNLLKDSNISSIFFAIEDNNNSNPIYYRITHFIVWVVSQILTRLQKSTNPTKYSLNIFGSAYIKKKIRNSDLLHVHWINNETLAIKDFKLLSSKSVITLHDEWFYCGAEHHALDNESYNRVTNGYTKENKNVTGLDINRYIWNYKLKYYTNLKDVIFTVPSTWMKNRAKGSILLKNHDIRVVPNPINIDVFKKINGNLIAGINKDDFVITFGAVNGSASKIKGFDLLLESIEFFTKSISSTNNVKIIVFGGKEKRESSISGIKTLELGHISSEIELAEIYSQSSIVVVPSRVESFGQVAAESLSCQTPVLAFNTSGLTDIVIHKENGFLAEPFSTASFTEGLLWLYNLTQEKRLTLGLIGREHVIQKFSNKVVREQLISIYKELELN